MKRAVFLDRDGTLNALKYYADSGENESPRTAADLKLLPGIIPALKRLVAQGRALFLVSNQPSYAKGKTSMEDLLAVHRRLEMALSNEGVQFLQAYYCYHHPKGIMPELTTVCSCRKPAPGLLFQARDTYDLDLSTSWMVGDQDTDVRCGQAASCRTILLEYPPSASKRSPNCAPDYHCADLTGAVDWILSH